ncbi:MAG: protease modulator HflC [Abitibacteriaceae bacterium]|nr:protease modulator HflC [Abditibacteriaceae bacterium]MBV9868156.1 protease modulator HflC [Abditibacteriaceae bacterium]
MKILQHWKWLSGLLVILLIGTTFYQVGEGEVAIVTQFGQVVAVVPTAGLHIKWPWQSRIGLDARLQSFNPVPSELLTRDKKNLVVDGYVMWRLGNPQRFLQAVADRIGAESRLQDMVNSELSIALGNHDLSDLISVNEKQVKIASIMADVTDRCVATARSQYGIEIVDVRLRRINLPEENKESVFARMRAERDRIARQYRAQGTEQATRIKAEADRAKTQILARSYEQAEKIKGQGDAGAMQIYANAYNRDPQFYKMTRTLDAYKKFLNDKTTIVLSSDSDLMRLLSSGHLSGKPK